VRNVAARGPQIDVVSWLHGIETMSCRAGLLATGDLTAAARMLAMDGRKLAGLSGADRVRDLITFGVSDRYATLRRSVGVAIAPDERARS
jgi:hypothetical protein